MKIVFQFEPRDQLFLRALLETGGTFSTSEFYEQFRDEWKNEIDTFIDQELLEHVNPDDEGAWIRYGLTKLGKEAAWQHEVKASITSNEKQKIINKLTLIIAASKSIGTIIQVSFLKEILAIL